MNSTPSSWSAETYTQTYWFAAEAHQGGQIKGSTLPYIVHPSLVAMEVVAALRREPGHDEQLAIQCALLHDVLEDTAVTFAQLSARFGQDVADGVLALSKDDAVPKEEQITDSLRRIQQQPDEVWMVKLADRISDLIPPPADWTAERIRRYWEDANEIHATLQRASPHLAQRLADKIDAYCLYLQPSQ